jgi:cysteine-rich repeat protein
VEAAFCQGGAVEISTAPGGTMMLCDEPTDTTCEQDFATLCPPGWDLCTHLQFNNRNAGWSYSIPSTRTVGEIYCRTTTSGAGHFTAPDSGASFPHPASSTVAFNCYFGSSRPSCTSGYGCNEEDAYALCCAPTTSCGNGTVDAPEEACDDANSDETDDCLNTCMWRVPNLHGMSGTNCR